MIRAPRPHLHRRPSHAALALLLTMAVGVVGVVRAQDAPQASSQQQIDALSQQLQAVQAQLRELMEQNKQLFERPLPAIPRYRPQILCRQFPIQFRRTIRCHLVALWSRNPAMRERPSVA